MTDLAGRPHNDLLIGCLGFSGSILEPFFISSFHYIHAKAILAKYPKHQTISIIGTMEIYVAISDQQTGPFSEQQIESMLNSGMIVLTDLAWHAGLWEWAPLHQVLNVSAPMALPARPPLLGASPRKTAHPSQISSNMIQKIFGSLFTLIGGFLFIKFLANIVSGSIFNIGYLVGYLSIPGIILFLGIFILTRK